MKNELIIIGVNFIITAIISWATAKIAFRSDIKKNLHSQREKIYFELYSQLDKILIDPINIYDREISKNIFKAKPVLKLIASKKVILSYKKIFYMIVECYQKLAEFSQENDPLNDVQEYEDEDGITHNNFYYDMTEAQKEFEFKKEVYKNKNLPDNKYIKSIIDELTNNMRQDLGSKKIKW